MKTRRRVTYTIKQITASTNLKKIGLITSKIKLGTMPVVGILATHYPL